MLFPSNWWAEPARQDGWLSARQQVCRTGGTVLARFDSVDVDNAVGVDITISCSPARDSAIRAREHMLAVAGP